MIATEKEFHDIVSNKDSLRKCTTSLLDTIMDDITLGIIFDMHRQYKTEAYSLIEKDYMVPSFGIKEEPVAHYDIFGQYNQKQTHECTCPKCNRSVAAQRFAPHLAECMGTGGRLRSRKGGRMNLHNNTNSCNGGGTDRSDSCSSYSEVQSDDDDEEWNSAEKRRKRKHHRNGSKRGKGTPKKNLNPEYEVVHEGVVDIEGDDEDLSKFREDHSNHSSPADSTSVTTNSSSGSTRKRDKSKNKRSRRDRTSSPVIALD